MGHEAYCDTPIDTLPKSNGLNPVFPLVPITMRSTLFALAKVVNVSTTELQDMTRASAGTFFVDAIFCSLPSSVIALFFNSSTIFACSEM